MIPFPFRSVSWNLLVGKERLTLLEAFLMRKVLTPPFPKDRQWLIGLLSSSYSDIWTLSLKAGLLEDVACKLAKYLSFQSTKHKFETRAGYQLTNILQLDKLGLGTNSDFTRSLGCILREKSPRDHPLKCLWSPDLDILFYCRLLTLRREERFKDYLTCMSMGIIFQISRSVRIILLIKLWLVLFQSEILEAVSKSHQGDVGLFYCSLSSF
jgi:hypothetical protein